MERHNDRVLTSAIVVLRAAAVVMSAVILLTSSPESGATRGAQISCLAVGAASLIVWAVIARRRDPVPHDGRMAVLFSVMAAASAATTSPRRGPLVVLAVIAALAAGESTRLVGGWVVTGVAFLAISTGAAPAGA